MKVSVLVMTYNHERFIERALDGALAQEVDFELEIIVSEDRSTDATREIVEAYARRHPTKFRLLLSERNLRTNEVVRRGIRAARGEYVALLDGDDYWTSPEKLRKQVRFLDDHPACAICFHNALVVREDGSREPWTWTPESQKEISTLDDLWKGNFIATCSTMFRNGLVPEIPDWYLPMFPITDWPLHILNAERGAVGYIDEVMSVYRHHEGGLYSSHDEARKQAETLRFYRAMNRNLGYRYARQIRAAAFDYFVEWADEYEARGNVARARECLRQALSVPPPAEPRSVRRVARLAKRLYAPGRLAAHAAQ
jgi:glycosyltransferase involved in cell wall biosynthesis